MQLEMNVESSTINVRLATSKDIPAILKITKEAFTKYAKDLGMPQNVHALKETEESIAAAMANQVIFIGELYGVPVGSVRYEQIGEVGYLSRFGVKLVAQGCGMGGRLVNAVVEDCRKRKLRAVTLHSSSKMFSLIHFYYGHGFYVQSTATDRGYIRALLVKDLVEEDTLTDYRQLLANK